jgi:nicotinic acid phosphoribosyltransferase
MSAPEQPLDLKQVAKLFNETLTAIRHDTPDFEVLESQAIVWLKNARYETMRGVETASLVYSHPFLSVTTNLNGRAIHHCRSLPGH